MVLTGFGVVESIVKTFCNSQNLSEIENSSA